MKKIAIIALSLLVFAIFNLAFTSNDTNDQTIAEIAAANEDFSILVSLLDAAGLVDVLNSEGEFTVFAPTNDAFEAVPAETLNALGENPDLLRTVLLYHVVPAKVMSADVVNLTEAPTAAEIPLTINTEDGVMVNNANVIAVDIEASNGVIHVIDAVLVPAAE